MAKEENQEDPNSKKKEIDIKDSLPGFYYSAEKVSKEGQDSYFLITKIRLAAVVLAAASSLGAAAASDSEILFKLLASISLISFFIALTSELSLRNKNPENDWYHGRALAESIKTLAWRYATKSGEYSLEEDEERTKERLIETIKNLINESSPSITLPVNTKPMVTVEMRSLRSQSMEDRRDCYLKQRIDDQISWYSSKARACKSKENRLRNTLIIAELVGIVASVMLLLRVSLLDFGALASAFIAALATWLAAKQYEYLSTSYSLTAVELSLVKEDEATVNDDDSFSKFVINAEQAMSREHTLWLARRVKPHT